MPDPNLDPLAKWNLAVRAFSAIGTVTVAVLAIWGDWIRTRLVPPKLGLSVHNARGTVIPSANGPRRIFYHLKVSNSRPWAPARNCRVLLKAVHRRGPDQQFHPAPLPVPMQFVWAPSGFTPPLVNIVSEQILDFGHLAEGAPRFIPSLYVLLSDFEGFVGSEQSVRFSLQIEADGYAARQYQVFEVAWSDNLDEMAQHLRIREVTSEREAATGKC